MKERIAILTHLGISIDYLEDAISEYKELRQLISEGHSVDDLEAKQTQKRADGAMASAMRFLERSKKKAL